MRIHAHPGWHALVLAISSGLASGQTPASIATAWAVGDGGNGHIYQAWNWNASWSACNSFATSVPGRYLATVTSGGENAFIFALITSTPGMYAPCATCNPVGPWIGGTFVSGGWTWATTGEPFCYANWAASQPANACPGFLENCIHYHEPSGGGSPSDRWNDLPSTGCPVGGLMPIGFVTEYQPFDLTVSQPFAGAPITVSDTGGANGFYVFNAFTFSADFCLNGWFFGLTMTFGELAQELSFFPFLPPFSSILDGAGNYSVTFPIPPGILFNYVGVLITPPPFTIISVSRPKSYLTI